MALCLLLVAFLGWAFTHLDKFSHDDDEGMNLLKADAVRDGYLLYRDVWSDQPPLYTMCLAAAFEVAGQTVFVARTVTVLFALALLLAAAWIGQELDAPPLALLTVPACVIVAPRFDGMARAAMIGLPAISLAMLSLGSLMRYLRKVRDKAPRNRRRWAALSGLLMSASFLTKPTMIYMAAWIFAWFCWRAWRVPSKTSSEHQPPWERELLIWTSFAMLPLLLCLLACGQPIVRQVVGTYLHPVGDLGLPLDPLGSLAGIGAHVVEADLSLWILLALGGVGLWALIGRQPEGSVLFLGVWLTTMLVITMQAPFRGRYMFLFLLPHTILAGMGLAELARELEQRLRLPTTAGQYVAAVAALLLLGYLRGIPAWFAPADPNPRGMAAVAMVSEHTAPDDLLITDQGMIAFRAGRSAVPYLSVISGRRIRSGNLTADELIAATANADPRMVIFWEDKLTDLPTYVDWVEGHYRLLHRWDERHRVYLREE